MSDEEYIDSDRNICVGHDSSDEEEWHGTSDLDSEVVVEWHDASDSAEGEDKEKIRKAREHNSDESDSAEEYRSKEDGEDESEDEETMTGIPMPQKNGSCCF